jgi:FdhE protein
VENPEARALEVALAADVRLLETCVATAVSNPMEELSLLASGRGIDPVLLASVFRIGLLPDLAEVTRGYAQVLATIVWDRGDCPYCGRPPVLAESRGLEQARWLRCGFCAGEWPAPRLACPFCRNSAPSARLERFVEGEGQRRRISACQSCGRYYKVVSTLARLSPPSLLVAELATMHLDFVAARDDFSHPNENADE